MVPPMGEVFHLGCPFYRPSSALQGWVPLCQLQFLSQHQPECSPGLEFLLSNRLVHHLLIQLESGSQAFIRRKKPDSHILGQNATVTALIFIPVKSSFMI